MRIQSQDEYGNWRQHMGWGEPFGLRIRGGRAWLQMPARAQVPPIYRSVPRADDPDCIFQPRSVRLSDDDAATMLDLLTPRAPEFPGEVMPEEDAVWWALHGPHWEAWVFEDLR